MAILCGNRAKHDEPTYHATVADVRACFAGNSAAPVAAQPVRTSAPVHEDGIYLLDGETPVKVQWNLTGTALYGKALGDDGKWVYAPGVLKELTADDRIPPEVASAFGKLYGHCINCGRRLTHELSQYWGYGETCAGNLGWPYYEVAEAHQALAV